MIELRMSYAELSFLRDLVGAEQLKIWKDQYTPRLKKNSSPLEISKVFSSIMNRESILFDTICDDKDCCNMLLRRFKKIEEGVKKDLEGETDET